MTESIEPRQGAFFPTENGGIVIGRVPVSKEGTPLVGHEMRVVQLICEVVLARKVAEEKISKLPEGGSIREAMAAIIDHVEVIKRIIFFRH